MLFQKFVVAAALTALVAAQEIERSDIPQQCTQVCARVLEIARDCDNRFDDNTEIQCICNATDARTLLPACDACVQQYDTDVDDDDDDFDDNNDNDVREVLNRCNFPVQSTFNSASIGSIATATATTGVSATRSSGNVAITNAASTSSAPPQISQASSAPSQVSQNAAPAMTAAAGMGFGALGLVLGML
ncbi:hypothetical protein OPT61_g7070 [Boeremia exigua]|uniref:Uncharacterized protein n=1 Tax=Boeremia exigua TaxID=749465 RepID=A0ACC2I4R9_9PLEO|nr:hypothetical protein OPT61_g7070 [Boeremia exigua]